MSSDHIQTVIENIQQNMETIAITDRVARVVEETGQKMESCGILQERVRTNPRLEWCLSNKEAILRIHSSEYRTNAFTNKCSSCLLWFKSCMFVKSQLNPKNEIPQCRWCRAEDGACDVDSVQFQVDHHMHCNSPNRGAAGHTNNDKCRKSYVLEGATTPHPWAEPVEVKAKMKLAKPVEMKPKMKVEMKTKMKTKKKTKTKTKKR